jgi:hypothetical protein
MEKLLLTEEPLNIVKISIALYTQIGAKSMDKYF